MVCQPPGIQLSYTGAKQQAKHSEDDQGDKVSPQEVDDYVNYALQYVDGPVAEFLQLIMKHFGTEAQAAELPKKNQAPLPAVRNDGS